MFGIQNLCNGVLWKYDRNLCHNPHVMPSFILIAIGEINVYG